MLTAVPDLPESGSWIQVLGRTAVHTDDDSRRLSGSAQRLLAVLVAAGPDGATAERIAEEIWGEDQPEPWRPALRMAVARLRKVLPSTCEIVADGGYYRVAFNGGWIDAWRLEEMASEPTPITEDDLEWMLAGRPFEDTDPREMVSATIQTLQMMQMAVAERFCEQATRSGDDLSLSTTSLLTALLREHAYNDRLALAIARTLAAGGRHNEALLALTDFAETYTGEFGAVPADISEFLAAQPTRTGPGLEHPPPELARPDDPPIAKELRPLLDSPLIGRSQELIALREARSAVLLGRTGSGKSRVLAELVSENDGVVTTYVLGDDQLDLPLSPFATAMATIRDDLLAAEFDGGLDDRRTRNIDERAIATRGWRIVLAHLEMQASVRPQRLVVDDAHLLDPASMGLLRLLIRSNTVSDVHFMVSGRDDFDEPVWLDLVRDAERAGLPKISLAGLDVSQVGELVRRAFPNASHRARDGLAAEVHETSDGLPAVAVPLIAAADPNTLSLPENLPGATALSRVTASLSERAPETVAAAAVLGYEFSIGALISLTELDENSVFSVLDELWRTGLIIETDDPDRVRFRHLLVQQSFLDAIPRFRRSQLNRKAAALATDTHQRADHEAKAIGLIPSETAASSLRESAVLYSDRQNWRKVIRQVRRIEEIAPEHLDAEILTLLATAIDLSGADGSGPRIAAFEMAVDNGSWEVALDAALSGLPESERPDGDRQRVEMLTRIPRHELPAHRRFDLVYNLARQSALLGENDDDALKLVNEALEMAGDPDEQALSHILCWMVTRHVEKVPHQVPRELLTDVSARVHMRVAQVDAIYFAEQGRFDASYTAARRFAELAAELDDPLRMWQAKGLLTMFVLNDARFAEARELAAENLDFGDLHDIQQNIAVFVGQRVYEADCRDQLAELLPQLELFKSNLSSVFLGRTARVLVEHAAGTAGDLGADVRAIVEEANERSGNFFAMIAKVLIARLVRPFAPDLVDDLRRQLQTLGDNPVIASGGGANFGPTIRYVAQLTDDDAERRALKVRAIEAADRQGPLIWRVLTRLDLAEEGHREALGEARDLAAGTELAETVERRAERLGES